MLDDECVSPDLERTLFKFMDNQNRDIYEEYEGNELILD
jgi:hypothetical protein